MGNEVGKSRLGGPQKSSIHYQGTRYITNKLINVEKQPEKVLLLGAKLPTHGSGWSLKDSIEELEELAISAGAQVMGKITQRLRKRSNTYVGKGKICEIKSAIHDSGIDTVICDDELSPNQQLSLEAALGNVKVIDRTALILDIFASNAHSREGKLQISLAQQEYLLPRLAGQWPHLERLGGGIGTRGPGESQIETDRRLSRTKIRKLKQDIDKVRQNRFRYRERRQASNVKTVALVGYTNAGKSTLLNTLTASKVLTENRMFSTLDPVTRKLILPSGGNVLITDTVGFVQRLPTNLVAAFRATLEELNDADLILHVLDVTHDRRLEQAESVEAILCEMGLSAKPTLVLMNKIDKLPDIAPRYDTSLNEFMDRFALSVFCSGTTGVGKNEILGKIDHSVFPQSF